MEACVSNQVHRSACPWPNFLAAEVRTSREYERIETPLLVDQISTPSDLSMMADGVIIINAHNQIITFNAVAERMFGYLATEVLGKHLSVLISENSQDQHEGVGPLNVQGLKAEMIETIRKVMGKRKDGSLFSLDFSVNEVELPDRQLILTFHDQSHWKQLERRWRTEHAIAKILGSFPTISGAMFQVLQELCETLRWEMGVMWHVDHDADVLRCGAIWHASTSQMQECVDLIRNLNFASGVGLPGRIWASGKPQWIMDVVKDSHCLSGSIACQEGVRGALGFPIQIEGCVVGVMEMFSEQIEQPDTEFLDMLASIGSQIGQFIQRKDTEEQRRSLEAQVCHMAKMDALGTLAGGIAHDFNNILTAIMGFNDLAYSELSQESPIRRHLVEVQKAGQRAKEIVGQILDFSRQQDMERTPVKLDNVVEDALKLLQGSLPLPVRLCSGLESASTFALVNPTQMYQVLLNLCTNAAHAMENTGGTVEVGLREAMVTSEFACVHPPLMPGPHVCLTVQDTGHGMTSAVKGRIFEPFFTTKDVGEGTGMGLAMVHRIVLSYDGAIVVESTPGLGTRFEIYLPQVQGMTEHRPLLNNELVPGDGECILFVDDEESICQFAKEMLTCLGYQVVVYTNSMEALEFFQHHPSRFDLVLTDQTMPNMSGEVFAHELLAKRADIPIIFFTGCSQRLSNEQLREMGIRACLMKPSTFQEMAVTIRQVLDAAVGVEC